MVRILLALMLVSVSARAQTDYLITSKADTLYGKARILTYDVMDRVQIDVGRKKEMFTALQIISASIHGEIYKPIRYENRILLMKLLKPGYLSLYAFRLKDQSTYDGRYFVRLDGTSMEVPNLGFKKIAGSYLEDCDAVVTKIKDGTLSKKALDQLIDEYNNCIRANASEIASTTKEPLLTVNEKTVAVESLMKKLDATDFASKKDALDLLKDIQLKVGKNESVPNYLTEGLKSYLSPIPALTEELNTLLSLLKK